MFKDDTVCRRCLVRDWLACVVVVAIKKLDLKISMGMLSPLPKDKKELKKEMSMTRSTKAKTYS